MLYTSFTSIPPLASHNDRVYISNREFSQILKMDDTFTDIQAQSLSTNNDRRPPLTSDDWTNLRLHCHNMYRNSAQQMIICFNVFNVIYSGLVRRARLCRIPSSQLKAIFSRANFRHRAQGRGSSLARDNPFLLSAIVVVFAVEVPGILRAENRVKIICANHVVPKVNTHPCVGRVRYRRGVDACRRQRYPRVAVVTFAVEPLGQLGFGQSTKYREYN